MGCVVLDCVVGVVVLVGVFIGNVDVWGVFGGVLWVGCVFYVFVYVFIVGVWIDFVEGVDKICWEV